MSYVNKVENEPISSELFRKDMSHIEKTTVDEELLLLIEYKRTGNKQSRDRIVERNIPYIMGIANMYRNHDMDYLELVNEGVLGFIKAIEKFDISLDYSLRTYSYWYIRQSIKDAVRAQGSTIVISVKDYFDKVRYLKYKREYHLITGDNSLENIRINYAIKTGKIISEQQQLFLEKMAQKAYNCIRLDESFGESDTPLINCIADNSSSTEQEWEYAILKEKLYEAYDSLSEREKYIYTQVSVYNKTRKELALEQKVTHQRITQVFNRALDKLLEGIIEYTNVDISKSRVSQKQLLNHEQ